MNHFYDFFIFLINTDVKPQTHWDLCQLCCIAIILSGLLSFGLWFYKLLRGDFFYLKKEKEVINHAQQGIQIIQTKCSSIDSPWWAEAKIYHIMVDRFRGSWETPPANANNFLGGTIQGITEKLDYIKGLGYNTILLTPVFQTEAYHGYHTIAYDNIDPHFGTWTDLMNLIREVHKREMHIICDYVPNHCHKKHPFFVEAHASTCSPKRKWFDFNDNYKYGYATFLNYEDLPKINLRNEEAAEYMINVAEMLISCGVDGLRIDHVIGLPFDFLRNLRARIKAVNKESFIIGEATIKGVKKDEMSQIYFESERLRQLALHRKLSGDELQMQYIGVIDGVLDFAYRDIIISEIQHGHRILGNVELVNELRNHFKKYPRDFALVLFFDNPDTERLLYYIDQYAKGDKSLLDEAEAFTKHLPYPSSIYYGTEQYMTHKKKVIGGEPYADLYVREPMDWVKGNQRS